MKLTAFFSVWYNRAIQTGGFGNKAFYGNFIYFIRLIDSGFRRGAEGRVQGSLGNGLDERIFESR